MFFFPETEKKLEVFSKKEYTVKKRFLRQKHCFVYKGQQMLLFFNMDREEMTRKWSY